MVARNSVALYACNIWIRHANPNDLKVPFILSVVGLALLVVSGWLGGKMVFEAGVGVSATDATTTARPSGGRDINA